MQPLTRKFLRNWIRKLFVYWHCYRPCYLHMLTDRSCFFMWWCESTTISSWKLWRRFVTWRMGNTVWIFRTSRIVQTIALGIINEGCRSKLIVDWRKTKWRIRWGDLRVFNVQHCTIITKTRIITSKGSRVRFNIRFWWSWQIRIFIWIPFQWKTVSDKSCTYY